MKPWSLIFKLTFCQKDVFLPNELLCAERLFWTFYNKILEIYRTLLHVRQSTPQIVTRYWLLINFTPSSLNVELLQASTYATFAAHANASRPTSLANSTYQFFTCNILNLLDFSQVYSIQLMAESSLPCWQRADSGTVVWLDEYSTITSLPCLRLFIRVRRCTSIPFSAQLPQSGRYVY